MALEVDPKNIQALEEESKGTNTPLYDVVEKKHILLLHNSRYTTQILANFVIYLISITSLPTLRP